MLNKEQAQVGDYLFYPVLKGDYLGYFIGFFSDIFHPLKQKVSHVSRISQVNYQDIKIIEAHIEDGVVEKVLNPKWYNDVIHMRKSGSLIDTDKIMLIKYMRKNLVGLKYDGWSFPSKFIRSLFIPKETPLLNDKKKMDCAETQAVADKKALGYQLRDNINIHTVNPQQLYKSHKLEVV